MQGSKNLVGLDEFSLFISKLLEDFRHTKIQSKGILIGNGLCEKPPITRPGKLVFSGHAQAAARTSSIALVNSVELYWLLCSVLSGETSDLAKIRQSILTSVGYVNLIGPEHSEWVFPRFTNKRHKF
jgi:hypothetical protein